MPRKTTIPSTKSSIYSSLRNLILNLCYTYRHRWREKIDIDIEKAKARLEAKREELENLSDLSKEARGTVELDQQAVGRLSRMDAMQQQAMAEAQERTRRHDLQRSEMAYRRIREGDYGYCSTCDEVIPDKRLEIDPMADKCVSCA